MIITVNVILVKIGMSVEGRNADLFGNHIIRLLLLRSHTDVYTDHGKTDRKRNTYITQCCIYTGF